VDEGPGVPAAHGFADHAGYGGQIDGPDDVDVHAVLLQSSPVFSSRFTTTPASASVAEGSGDLLRVQLITSAFMPGRNTLPTGSTPR
jgi:hypothetical protein